MIASATAASAAARRRHAANGGGRSGNEYTTAASELSAAGRREQAEADIAQLKAMFEGYEEDVLFMLLQQNSYDINATIDVILSMTDATPNQAQEQGQEQEQGGNTEVLEPQFESSDEPADGEHGDSTEGAEADEDADAALAAAIAAATVDEQLAAAEGMQGMTDEQLAFMLQNDVMFQQELRAYFGEDFQLADPQSQQQQQAGDRERRPSNESSASAAAAAAAASASATGAAMVRGLASMGGELRRQLGSFAERYLQQQSAGNSGGRGQWRARDEEVDDDEEGLELLLPASGREEGVARSPSSPSRTSEVASRNAGNGAFAIADDEDDDDEMETINLMVR